MSKAISLPTINAGIRFKFILVIIFTFTFSLFTSMLCSAQDYYTPAQKPPPHPKAAAHKPFNDSLRQKPFFFALNAGVSFPILDFGAKDTTGNFMVLTNNNSTDAKGYATIGFHINAKGGYYLTPNFGLLAKVGLNHYGFDASSFNTTINGYYYYIITGSYNVWQLMGGGFATMPVNSSLSLRGEIMVGGIISNFPDFSADIGGVETFSGSLAPAHDFAYSFSGGIEQVINETVSFTSSLSYTGALLSYPTSNYTLTSGTASKSFYQNYPIFMKYGSIDLSIGLLFHL